jgi:hypothetical protein
MTIKTNAEGKVVLRVSADVALDGGYIVHLSHDMPIDDETQEPKTEDGVVYVDSIPAVPVGHDLYFDGTAFTTKPNTNHEQAKLRAELQSELDNIDRWLYENDWKVNKVVIGEWSKDDARWEEYLAERTKKRERRDVIVAMLGGA